MSGTKGAAPLARVGRTIWIPVLVAGLAACTTTGGGDQAEINTKTKFASADYGVKASPRVTTSKTVRVGGGRYQVGKPYEVAGKWYHPKVNPDYNKVGIASWYGPNFHGRLTANGEVYNQYSLTAANPTLPLPCYARVTNEDTGDSVIVRVNDRGPFARGRIIDLSTAAAKLLHMRQAGVAKVRVKYVGLAPLDRDDSSYLMASYRPGADGAPAVNPDTGETGVMMAMNGSAGLPGVTLEDGTNGDGGAGSGLPTSANAMVPVPVASPAAQGIETAMGPATSLPAVGPVPSTRPTLSAAVDEEQQHQQVAELTASAYVSRHATVTPAAFEQVLDSEKLTPETIVRAWNHGLVATN